MRIWVDEGYLREARLIRVGVLYVRMILWQMSGGGGAPCRVQNRAVRAEETNALVLTRSPTPR